MTTQATGRDSRPMAGALPSSTAAIVVAHPDDETLWAGGFVLSHPDWRWFVVSLCRANDPDRAPRFFRVLERLGAAGAMADLDDGPEQTPLPEADVRHTILSLLPPESFDLVLTHGPRGEYTRHRRHEETSRAVVDLWKTGRLGTGGVWMFAYEDGGRAYLPRAEKDAHRKETLPAEVWRSKYEIVTGTYGFSPQSWEARTTPREEAFWCFDSPEAAATWTSTSGARDPDTESSGQ